MQSSARLADVIGGLSVIADLGFGLPPQNALRSSLIATALAKDVGADETELEACFYVPLLMHIGCISMSHETAALFGDELEITRAVALTNLGDPQDIVETLIPQATRGLTGKDREERTSALIAHTATFGAHYTIASGEVARQTAQRIGLSRSIQDGLTQVDEAWDGSGAPGGLSGEDISFSARVTRLASDAAFFDHLGGPGLAAGAVRARSGTLHDPGLAKIFCAKVEEIVATASSDEPLVALASSEPGERRNVSRADLVHISAAFGDAADLKMPHTQGHSGATADIAAAAAERLGFDRDAIDEVRVAAHLHDVGRVAISNAVWEKAGPLRSSEWEQVRLHTYHGERIVAASSALCDLARVVGMHHERGDGSGYHRGSRSAEIPTAGRIVAVADAWVSMNQPRPHRAPLGPDRAVSELQSAADAGRFDPQVVAAVLSAAGHTVTSRPALPGGLSKREIDVLRLVAAGRSNPQIAEELHISRRTAEHHVQHIYTKIGVSTRPGAAMFAVANGLLEPLAT